MAGRTPRKSLQRRKSLLEESEYERQEKVLGFPLVATIDNIINAAIDYSCDAIDSLETDLNKILRDERNVKRGCDELCEYFNEKMAKQFDLFEIYVMRNCFQVPPHITEPVYLENKKEHSDIKHLIDESETIEKEIQELRTEIEETRYEIAYLQHLIAQQKSVLSHEQAGDIKFNIIEQIWKEPSKLLEIVNSIKKESDSLQQKQSEASAIIGGSLLGGELTSMDVERKHAQHRADGVVSDVTEGFSKNF